MASLTLCIEKNSIISDLQYRDPIYFYNKIIDLKTQFGLFDFFFLYKNFKIFLDPFIRSFPLDFECNWAFFNQPILQLYGFTTDQSYLVEYRNQQFYYTNPLREIASTVTAPIYFLPFSMIDAELIYDDRVKSASLFQDNNRYNVFGLGRNPSFSNIVDRSNFPLPYCEPEYCFVNNQIANKPITITGTSFTIQYITTVNPQKTRDCEILIIFMQGRITNFSDNGWVGAPYNQICDENIIDANAGLNTQQSYFLIYPYFEGKVLTCTCSKANAIIAKAYIARIPICGNSVAFNPEKSTTTFDENFTSQLVPIQQLRTGQVFNGTIFQDDSTKASIITQEEIYNQSTTSLSVTLAPSGVVGNQRFYETWYKSTAITPTYTNGNRKGFRNIYNFNIKDLPAKDYIALPSDFPYSFMLLTFGRFYASSARLYDGIVSELPPNFPVSMSVPTLASAFYLKSTMTSSVCCLRTAYDFATMTTSYLTDFSRRYNSNINASQRAYIIYGMDPMRYGMRTTLINTSHLISCYVPSLLVLHMTKNFLFVNGVSQDSFSFQGISQELLSSIKIATAKIYFSKPLQSTRTIPENITGYLTCEFSKQNLNIISNQLIPLVMFNMMSMKCFFQQVTSLSLSKFFNFKIQLDDTTINNTYFLSIVFIFC